MAEVIEACYLLRRYQLPSTADTGKSCTGALPCHMSSAVKAMLHRRPWLPRSQAPAPSHACWLAMGFLQAGLPWMPPRTSAVNSGQAEMCALAGRHRAYKASSWELQLSALLGTPSPCTRLHADDHHCCTQPSVPLRASIFKLCSAVCSLSCMRLITRSHAHQPDIACLAQAIAQHAGADALACAREMMDSMRRSRKFATASFLGWVRHLHHLVNNHPGWPKADKANLACLSAGLEHHLAAASFHCNRTCIPQ